jgi:glycerol kinase
MSINYRMADEEYRNFVRVWESSRTASIAAARLEISPNLATHRASFLRKKGVPLKRYANGQKIKPLWAELTKLVESLRGQSAREIANDLNTPASVLNTDSHTDSAVKT